MYESELRYVDLNSIIADVFAPPRTKLQIRTVMQRDRDGNAITATPWRDVPTVSEPAAIQPTSAPDPLSQRPGKP